MSMLHNIRTVAAYEAKILRRSWFFRLFSLGAMFILTILNIGFFSPVGNENWKLVALPSSVPYLNLYLLNIGQAIVIIFLAADFLKKDKKLDTNEVLYTRPMSNLEYILGKTWGIVRLFLGLNIVILSVGLLMNFISPSMKIDFRSYISYLFIISIPTIVFSLGLAFLLMSLIRNQALTFLVLLGLAALDMFYLWYRGGFIFDYMAFGLPVFKSEMVGFDNPGFIINQRLMFFFLGMSFVFATVLLFNRLPQSRIHTGLSSALFILFLSGAVFCGNNIHSEYKRGKDFKKLVVATNKKYENRKFCSVTEARISLVHKGNSLSATASLKLRNDNSVAVDRYIFSLNPLLKVDGVFSGNEGLRFTRDTHIVDIEALKALEPGQTDSLSISYSGTISESFCYPDYTDNPKSSPYRVAILNINKRQAFLEDKYVLLTPETYWYPVAALSYYPGDPARIKVDFTMYTLKVESEAGLSVLAQGKKETDGNFSVFKPENPLTGLTLIIGNYRSDTLKVDSISYITHYFPGHDYYKKDLAEIKDTLPGLVSGIMTDLETSLSARYPFKTLSLVEVPVQYYSFPRKCTQTRSEVQPSMVLLPEKLLTFDDAGFYKRFTRQKRWMSRDNQVLTDKEIKVRIFNDFIKNTFISGMNYSYVNGVLLNEPLRYRLGPSFYFFKNNFYSSDYPVINAVFESHLQHLSQNGNDDESRDDDGSLTDNDKANLVLQKISFRELLAKNPSWDTTRNVLAVKGEWLMNLLRSRAGIDEFNNWFSAYIEKNRFRTIDLHTLANGIKDKFGFDFYPYLDNWFNGKEQPGFVFSGLRAKEIVVGDRSRYQVTLVATNPEPVAGLFKVFIKTGGLNSKVSAIKINGNQGAKGSAAAITIQVANPDNISRIIFLGPGETRKIGIVLDAQPRALLVSTMFSRNIPGDIIIPITDIAKSKTNVDELNGEMTLPTTPLAVNPNEIIVDNEDPGFSSSKKYTTSPLKKFFGIDRSKGLKYAGIRNWNIPEYWQPVVLSAYYGKFIRSAVYTKAGVGDRWVTWRTLIRESGYYDIFCYIGKTSANRNNDEQEDGDREQSPYRDFHYRIYHDEGVQDITIDYSNADPEWNFLGRYYLKADTAKVVLTNKSSGRIVVGDAVRWVKQN